jgi:UDP-glucose 4-epimerase
MKILITGGAGFIGSHLAESLLEQGHQVVALDSMTTGSRQNVAHLSGTPEFSLVDGSVLDESVLEPLVAEADIIYHLAATVGVKLIMEQLVTTLESNVQGTENVIRLAHTLGNKKVIIASSSEVYGKSPAVPWSEDDDILLGPTSFGRWGYACSKMLDEFLALAYSKEKGLPVVVLRLFNTVGPRQAGQYGMVLPRFVSQATAGEPITVYGDGAQTRCFTFVGDVVDGITRISQNTEAEGQVFNIGSNNEVTINQLAELVKETLASSSPISHVPYSDAYGGEFEDIARRIPAISKIQKYIEFNPKSDLKPVIKAIAKSQQTPSGELASK